jgi:putative nucleotidyltransferase with HDIG domain
MSRSVLYVDDEPALCRAFERALRGVDIRVVTFTSAPEAVQRLDSESFDVIASDYRMPELDGLSVLRAARSLSPGAKRLLVSGQGDFDVDSPAIREAGVDAVVTKPWSLDTLRRVVSLAANHAAVERENRKLSELLADEQATVARLRAEFAALAERQATQLTEVLSRALGLRDRETLQHSRRVAAYSSALAIVLGLDLREQENVYRAALLHDVGKVGVNDCVLYKPEPLSAGEWLEVKRHAEDGAGLLRDIEPLGDVRSHILQHHERWDGAGYPARLAGDVITLGARIIALTDSYDAIRSDRPYRRGRPHAAAVEELARCSGAQFDPRVVQAFLSLSPRELEELSLRADGAPL